MKTRRRWAQRANGILASLCSLLVNGGLGRVGIAGASKYSLGGFSSMRSLKGVQAATSVVERVRTTIAVMAYAEHTST